MVLILVSYLFQSCLACLNHKKSNTSNHFGRKRIARFIFGMAAMPSLCNGTLLFQGNLPRVLPVIIYKHASCLIPYIVSFWILFGKWSSLVIKDFKKYFCFQPNVFSFCMHQKEKRKKLINIIYFFYKYNHTIDAYGMVS